MYLKIKINLVSTFVILIDVSKATKSILYHIVNNLKLMQLSEHAIQIYDLNIVPNAQFYGSKLRTKPTYCTNYS